MGLGLERWDLRYWYAYVVATLLAEAWLIGLWAQQSWLKSIGRSLVGNAITGLMCGGIGCFAVVLHNQMAGSADNPNPLIDSIAILTLCAFPSRFIALSSIAFR